MSFMKNLEKAAKQAGKKAQKAVKPLKKGAKGTNIKDAQKALKKKLKVDVKIDGKFGPKMEDLIKQAQKKAKVKQTGELDAMTMAYLELSMVKDIVSSMKEDMDEDLDALKALQGKTLMLKPLKSEAAEMAKKREELKKQIVKLEKILDKTKDDAMLATLIQPIIAAILIIVHLVETAVTCGPELEKLARKVSKLAA